MDDFGTALTISGLSVLLIDSPFRYIMKMIAKRLRIVLCVTDSSQFYSDTQYVKKEVLRVK